MSLQYSLVGQHVVFGAQRQMQEMGITKRLTMGMKRTDEFRQDAVRIALTSGLTRKQVADDLGVGMSTLNKWITAHRVSYPWKFVH